MTDLLGDPAIAPCFILIVDGGRDLGAFMSCEGLGAEVVTEQREEGGNNDFIHILPVRLKYPNIKLTRPLNRDSGAVAEWFASMKGDLRRTTAHIKALRADESEVASWDLDGVIPVRWQGPSFNVDQLKHATETLELAHHGFTYKKPV